MGALIFSKKEDIFAMDVIEAFPELREIGKDKLQTLANRWVATPVPKECAVSHVTISEKDGRLKLDFGVRFTHRAQDGEDYHFPMDDLIKYWCEYGIGNTRKRELVLNKLLAARQKFGPKIFQRFHLRLGHQYRMLLKCKTCRSILETEYTRGAKDKVLPWSGHALCLTCGNKHPYDQDDFFITL